MSHRFAAIFLVAAVLTVSSCSGAPPAVRQAELVKRADALLAEGKTKEAIVQYRIAVEAAPNAWEVRVKLADAFLRVDNLKGALAQYLRAADLAPKNTELQLKAGRLLLTAGAFQDARARAEAVLAVEPRNVQAQVLAANSLAGLRDLDGAISELEEAIRAGSGDALSYGNLGVLQAARGDVAAAEASLKRAVAANPKSVELQLALANLYWASNRTPEAERGIGVALALDPKNQQANRALALVYLATGRAKEAEAPVRLVAESTPGPAGRLTLLDYYVATRQSDKATAVAAEVIASGAPEAAQARLRLASLGLRSGDVAAAYREVDAVLAKDAGNVDALVARAHLEVGDGKSNEAIAHAKSAIERQPDSAPAHYVLGRAYFLQYQIEQAEQAFRTALQNNPRFGPAAAELARVALVHRRYEEAVTYARLAVEVLPAEGAHQLLLAQALIVGGKPAEAEARLRGLATNFPKNPWVHAELGRVLEVQGNRAAARAAYERAVAIDALNVSALTGLVTLDLKDKRNDAARSRAAAAAAAAPANADVQIMAGRAYATLGDLDAAAAALKKALDLDARNPQTYALLSEVYVRQNRVDAAIAESRNATERQPRAIGAHTILASLLHVSGKLDEAKTVYERILTIDPKAPIAANNLAQLYVDRGENLDVALTLAQVAKAGLPNSHEVDDTIGWIYYRKGLAGQAVAALKAAVAAQPVNAVYLYHLGAAYALNKDKPNARQALQKSLTLQPNFTGADDARKILASLN